MSKCLTEIENEWLIENYNKYSNKELQKRFNNEFHKNVGRSLDNRCYKLIQKGLIVRSENRVSHSDFRYTKEMINWLVENKPKMTVKELLKNFEQKFKHRIKNYNTLKRCLYNHKIDISQYPSQIDYINYQKYNVGDIFIHQGKYWIKINNLVKEDHQNYSKNKNYVQYDRYIWEHYNKKEFPKNMYLFHKDGNLLNDNIDNLLLVNKNELYSANKFKNIYVNFESLLEANIMIKRLNNLIKEKEK